MDDYTISRLEQRIARLESLIRLQFALSRSTTAVVDTGPVQTVQGKIDPLSIRDGMPIMQNYGFSSSLPVGGDKAVVFLNGDRSQAVVVATNHQTHRFKGLNEGEVVIYDQWGHSLRFTSAGVTLTGNLAVVGGITATGGITGGLGTADQVTLQGHHHDLGPAPTAGT